MKRNSFRTLLSLAVLAISIFSLTACNKVMVHSKDKEMEPVAGVFNVSQEDAFKAGKEALVRLGYKISREDADLKTAKTTWQSTKATSHYIDLFDHRDYGTVGAYYRIELKVFDRAGKTTVEVSAPTRSIVSARLKTAFREEKKVLKKMADLLRRDDFEITNVGVEE